MSRLDSPYAPKHAREPIDEPEYRPSDLLLACVVLSCSVWMVRGICHCMNENYSSLMDWAKKTKEGNYED